MAKRRYVERFALFLYFLWDSAGALSFPSCEKCIFNDTGNPLDATGHAQFVLRFKHTFRLIIANGRLGENRFNRVLKDLMIQFTYLKFFINTLTSTAFEADSIRTATLEKSDLTIGGD